MREISAVVLSDHDPAKSCKEMRARTLSETDLVVQSSGAVGLAELLKNGLGALEPQAVIGIPLEDDDCPPRPPRPPLIPVLSEWAPAKRSWEVVPGGKPE